MKSLKNVLLINAVSSGATGVGLIVFARTVADLFGTSQSQAFTGVGIFLVVFAAGVLYEGIQKSPRPLQVYTIITLDVLWVIGSFTIVLPQLFNLSVIGYIAITAVALWVAAMAYLQIREVKQVTTA
jgi:divalent metal cation (Fe/Co/Zn/Cd) transporter